MSTAQLDELDALISSALVILFTACGGAPEHAPATHADTSAPQGVASIAQVEADLDLHACKARQRSVEALPELPGAPMFDGARVEFLGRARGEPMVFVREPAATADDRLPPLGLASRRAFERAHPGGRVAQLRGRHRRDPPALRALLLREGYAYAPNPHDALGIVNDVRLTDLFEEPEIRLQRANQTRILRRVESHNEVTYRYVDGPLLGHAADLLFGDRVAIKEEELAAPLHRDMRGLAEFVGFDQAKIQRRTETAILAELRFGALWVPAVVESRGAELSLACLAADRATREAVAQYREAKAPYLRAMHALHDVVSEELSEALRFDRPEGEKTAEHDGELRPMWISAYLQGRTTFTYGETTFPVFNPSGRPWPPEVCVDFVLDSFERTAGTWYVPRGGSRDRVHGRLDFDEVGIQNRRGVMAFAKFAEDHPDLFAVRRFVGPERVAFEQRSRYFGFFGVHQDEVRAGDVVAIHGLKQDGRIHQHAILVEWLDPITGFPYGLADQMKRPRRRTWEGIMAEAPLRSLYYRVRPREIVWEKLDPEPRPGPGPRG